MPSNIYQPDLMEVLQVRQQTADVKSVRIRFRDEERARAFSFRVGQFGIFSAFGAGESAFNICSSSDWTDFIEFCFRRTGRVTEALWNVEEGDTIGFRGPYGNGYPLEKWKGKNLIFIGGGIAMPPIRCAIWYALENREDYGDITIVYGARTVGDMVFAGDLRAVGRLGRRAGCPLRRSRRRDARLGRRDRLRADGGRAGRRFRPRTPLPWWSARRS